MELWRIKLKGSKFIKVACSGVGDISNYVISRKLVSEVVGINLIADEIDEVILNPIELFGMDPASGHGETIHSIVDQQGNVKGSFKWNDKSCKKKDSYLNCAIKIIEEEVERPEQEEALNPSIEPPLTPTIGHEDVDIVVMYNNYEGLKSMDTFSYEELRDACCDCLEMSVDEFFEEIDNDGKFLSMIPFICAVDRKLKTVVNQLYCNGYYVKLYVEETHGNDGYKEYDDFYDLCDLFKVINDGYISYNSVVTVDDYMPRPSKENVAIELTEKEPIHAEVEILVLGDCYRDLPEHFSFENVYEMYKHTDCDAYSVKSFFKEIENDKEFLYSIPFICAVDMENKRVLSYLKDDERYINIFTADRIDYFNELREKDPSLSNINHVTFDNLCELFDHINAHKITSVDIAVVEKVGYVLKVMKKKKNEKVDITIDVTGEEKLKDTETDIVEKEKAVMRGDEQPNIRVVVVRPGWDHANFSTVEGLVSNKLSTQYTVREFITKLISDTSFPDTISYIGMVDIVKDVLVDNLSLGDESLFMFNKDFMLTKEWMDNRNGITLPIADARLKSHTEINDLGIIVNSLNKGQWKRATLIYDTLSGINVTGYYVDPEMIGKSSV